MTTLGFQKNMGTLDRGIRLLLGGLMLADSFRHPHRNLLQRGERAVGGAFLVYGLTGFDPLLAAYGASTIPGSANSIWNQFKATLPGQGIPPQMTDNVKPTKTTYKPLAQDVPLATAMAIE